MKNQFGFLVIDKPKGLSSHACVNILRRCYGIKRVGHGGTLDPSVTGVLPIAIGAATRLFRFLPGEKAYLGSIQLGIITDTDDLEGNLISSNPIPYLNEEKLNKVLDLFKGSIQQKPPLVSAVHVDGMRAYKRLRLGQKFDLAKREVIIHKICLQKWDYSNGIIDLEIHCSSGTYIRSLARDIGEVIGCGGCLADLRRTKALGFDHHLAYNLQTATEIIPTPISPLRALSHLPQRKLTFEEEDDWQYGRYLSLTNEKVDSVIVIIRTNGDIAGIATRNNENFLRPKVVFNARC